VLCDGIKCLYTQQDATILKTLSVYTISSVSVRAKLSHRNKKVRKIIVGVRQEDKIMDSSESTFT
jgi:hypothetical protein